MNATIEMCMSEYFLVKSVLGKYLDDSKALFSALGKILLIPDGEIDRLYELSENELAKDITSVRKYLQYQRMQEYSNLVGSVDTVNAEWAEVADIKGSAILFAQSSKLLLGTDASRNTVFMTLSQSATSGTVRAMRMMAILQCEGIFLGKNVTVGLKTLRKAADWNDSISTLALLRYSKDGRKFNLSRLSQQVANTPFEELYCAAAKAYGVTETSEVKEVTLLEKSFNLGGFCRDVFDSKCARVLYSHSLSFGDKEKALFSLNRNTLGVIGDLPLKLSQKNVLPVDVSEVQGIAIKRDSEVAFATQALKNGDLRGLESYRPLCICSESKYMLNMYARAIATEQPDVHVERFDVAELNQYDLHPSASNIFVRSVDENKDNRFLLFLRGEISEAKREIVKCILQSNKRAKFHLVEPSVTLDLSPILPICFCDEQNARWLKAYCDVVTLDSITSSELPKAVSDIVASKQKLYGVGNIDFVGDVESEIGDFDVDTAERLIDAAVRALRDCGKAIMLSREILQKHQVKSERRAMGFGGGTNGRY